MKSHLLVLVYLIALFASCDRASFKKINGHWTLTEMYVNNDFTVNVMDSTEAQVGTCFCENDKFTYQHILDTISVFYEGEWKEHDSYQQLQLDYDYSIDNVPVNDLVKYVPYIFPSDKGFVFYQIEFLSKDKLEFKGQAQGIYQGIYGTQDFTWVMRKNN